MQIIVGETYWSISDYIPNSNFFRSISNTRRFEGLSYLVLYLACFQDHIVKFPMAIMLQQTVNYVESMKLFKMTSSNGNIFRLLALCAGNYPVTGDFPSQRPVTRSFVFFFDLLLNKRLSKQSWGWWFETPSRSLWRHCDIKAVLNFNSTSAYCSSTPLQTLNILELEQECFINPGWCQGQLCNRSLRYEVTLRWRHNERDGVSNHQPPDCLLSRLFRRRSKKHQRTPSLAFEGTADFSTQRASNAGNVSIWWCHHDKLQLCWLYIYFFHV